MRLLRITSERLALLEARLAGENPKLERPRKQGMRLMPDGRKQPIKLPLSPEEIEGWFWSMVEIKPSGCWEFSGPINSNGYGVVCVDGRTGVIATRLVVRLIEGGWPSIKEHVCHRCDNPPCVNPNHLWIGSGKENNSDRSCKGRSFKGPRVLTEEQVNQITESGYKRGYSTKFAKMFGVAVETVAKIHRKMK